VIRSGDVLGCISIIWIRSALDPREAALQFSTPLLLAAAQLGAAA
jgi:hypothetical protein